MRFGSEKIEDQGDG